MRPSRDRAVLAALLLAAGSARAEDARRSGFDDMAPQTQAMQRDDSANPAMLWVLDGEALWRATASGAPSCAGCHGEPSAMAGVAARYPSLDDASGRPVTLEGRIQACRTRHQGLTPLPPESRDLLALAALVARQSRGLPITPPDSPALAEARDLGRMLFHRRQGQLDLACADCHDRLAGHRLGGSIIPQGHPTGYPLYRLEWQSVGSLERRLRGCMTGVRAEPYPAGSPEMVALQAFLMERAKGMPMDAPAVRP